MGPGFDRLRRIPPLVLAFFSSFASSFLLQEQGWKNIMDSHGHIDEILVPQVIFTGWVYPVYPFLSGSWAAWRTKAHGRIRFSGLNSSLFAWLFLLGSKHWNHCSQSLNHSWFSSSPFSWLGFLRLTLRQGISSLLAGWQIAGRHRTGFMLLGSSC